MDQAALKEFSAAFFAEQQEILGMKGASYSGATTAQGDRLANFKRTAAALGLRPLQAWAIFFLKHVDSITTYVKTGHESETPRGRLLDAANYALLGAALIEEESLQKVS